MLESGKAFREKKALPILGKLLKYARSLFRENTELKAKVQKLEKENTAFKSANWNHTHETVRLKMENQELHKAKDKLDALVLSLIHISVMTPSPSAVSVMLRLSVSGARSAKISSTMGAS